MRSTPPAFSILWRAFLEQLVANESATSELQTRRAILGVLAFLVTPGLYLMMTMLPAKNLPISQMAVLFVAYSMVTTGLIAVFTWDALVFDTRDAMVLGPLPVRGTTIVAAKLAALATFLLGATLAVNLTSGVPFAVVTGIGNGLVLRHLSGHLAGTIGGAIFVFAVLVIARGLLVTAPRNTSGGHDRISVAIRLHVRRALLHGRPHRNGRYAPRFSQSECRRLDAHQLVLWVI